MTNEEGLSGSYVQAASQLTRGQLLDLLLEVEDRLRALVRAVFARERSDWLEVIPEAIRRDLRKQAAARGAPPDSNLLTFATLKQLIDTMLGQWALFQPILRDKVWLQANLEDLRIARNDLAHGVQPQVDDRVRIALLASEVGKRLPLQAEPPGPAMTAGEARRYLVGLVGQRILWADDVPEGNAWARRILTGFGAEVIPVLTNEEAVQETSRTPFNVAVSDIDRGGGESGAQLGVRLKAAGFDLPIVFFVARVDPSLPPPVGGVLVTNDLVAMFARLLAILRPDALGLS